MSVTVSRIELRDHFVVKTQTPSQEAVQTSRWTLAVVAHQGPLPKELPPTAFLDADVPFKNVLAAAGTASEILVRAWALRGDNLWTASQPIRIR